MNDKSSDEREILIQLHRHLTQTLHAASLLQGDHDDFAEIEQVRNNVDAAIVSLKRAIAAMVASIAQHEAERHRLHRFG